MDCVIRKRSILSDRFSVIDSRKQKKLASKEDGPASGPQTASLFEEKTKSKSKASTTKSQHRLNIKQLHELEAEKEREVLRSYRRVTDLWPCILSQEEGQEEAEREWMFEAEKLVDAFRETRNLFHTTRVRALVTVQGRRGTHILLRAIPSVVCFPGVDPPRRGTKPKKTTWLRVYTSISVRIFSDILNSCSFEA